MKTLLLVDGHAIIHRAFHALPPLSNREGIPTNAIYGFFGMLHKATVDFHPDFLVVCFDTPKPTFRKKLFKKYQSNRPAMDDTLKPQIPYIKKLLDLAHIARLEKPGFEADDVIGTIAAHNKQHDLRILILTGDRDLMQLSTTTTLIMTPRTGLSDIHLYTPQEVEKKMGVKPKQIPDFKALAGDPSDNYRGVEGVGQKTAANLITRFDNIEKLYQNLSTIDNSKLQKKLANQKKDVLLFKKLATIVTDIKTDLSLEKMKFSGFNSQMKEGLQQLQLSSLLKRFFDNKPQLTKKISPVKTINSSQINLF
ncbi:hypothetical protein A3F03_04280 [Candidatus Roizmanbacteria bacterium RIFCSPHIGHO2_12_FULL_41_11]|uniref:5'-3' exonuclease domain-containing protein n=2 Tax=Candidatus Roizmaniibacteriota TaxID=1752723 RepID=A0A1F7JB01_9BACT|nr:MAG: hypothetical protein A3F03_04280 [Candidatus Roizmanbacteria bacterium RIFCSPHIGHO2_12_FULL_41_11]OGK52799.1 MAG: hypothetical protein A2966_04820 [Candidatus Roizmanbacteria bacterium RIFCSPLOWO2_01_FULL_41_22]